MSLRGEIQTMPLPDLFQWLEMMRKTGTLALGQGGVEQKFHLCDGAIATATSTAYHATDSEENVRLILADTLRWTEGRFEFTEAPLPAEIVAINLQLGTQQLVLDTFREFDEAEEAARAMGATAGRYSEPAPTFTLADGLRLAIIDRLLRGEFKVPLLPTVVSKVLEITRRDDFSLRDLSDVILADQVIAAQVLKQANSAAFGGERYIDSLPLAVQRLGSQAVTNLVLALSLQSAMSGRDLFLADKKRLWQHSVACALLARIIAATARLDRETAFLCGLMQDFGKIVLLSLIQDIMSKGRDYQMAPAEVVAEIIQTYHPKVGGVVGEKWCLPAPVLEAIIYHHSLTAAGEHRAYAAVASLSDTAITFCAQAPESPEAAGVSPAHEMARTPAAQLLNLPVTQMTSILECGPECLKFAREFLVK